MDTNILVVSADPATRLALSELVETAGHAPITCAGPGLDHCPGLAADSCALTSAADAVLIDVTSVQHLAALKAHYTAHGVPVVGTTESPDPVDVLTALADALTVDDDDESDHEHMRRALA